YKATKEEKYLDGAIKILKAHEQDCIFDDSDQSILQNGMEAYKRNTQKNLVYADFFLVEAIAKLKGMDYLIW
ncbi:MAG: glycosyl hydrolase family 88, partial [Clostridia bacterium]|nr:glycosyl hydrolase family 88 [Clostridia bacterium]